MLKVKEVRNTLMNMARDTRNRLHDMTENALGESMFESIQELSLYDNHPGDVGTEVFERSKDLALRDRLSRQLADVDAALQRLQNGIYGECLHCRELIEEARLRVLPTVALCSECQKEEEASHPDRHVRPIEEDVIMMPWAQNTNELPTAKHPGSDNGFDGEDAWQIVARYGSSETPSDYLMSPEYPNVYPDHDENVGYVEEVEGIPYFKDETGNVKKNFAGLDDDDGPSYWI